MNFSKYIFRKQKFCKQLCDLSKYPGKTDCEQSADLTWIIFLCTLPLLPICQDSLVVVILKTNA